MASWLELTFTFTDAKNVKTKKKTRSNYLCTVKDTKTDRTTRHFFSWLYHLARNAVAGVRTPV